jgi:hypothetical protein
MASYHDLCWFRERQIADQCDLRTDFHRALNSTALLRPILARSLLGWEPRKPPLAEGMKVYYHAWLASTA